MQRRVSEASFGSLDSQSDDGGVQEGSASPVQDTSSHDVSEYQRHTLQSTTHEKKKPLNKRKAPSRQPAVGPKIYIRFEQQVRELDAELRKLGNKARALGRSAGILAASTRLRERLGRVLYLFRENALALYPAEMKEYISVHHTPVRHVRRWKTKNFLDPTIRLQAPLQDVSDSKHDSLAQEFWQLSKDVITLFECFGQYPEFLEELPDFSLAEDLQAWAKLLLDNFEHDLNGMAFQQFLFDSMPEIGARLETLAKQFIQVFTKIGIPTVKASQDHGASNLQNQTIVAALFAGVATGMIQVFTTNETGGLHDWIVLLWYMTLIFSVASAVNGLLNLSWMQAIYRSPDSHVPWWVIIWIKRFPLVFLVLAVGCFFVALILFALTPQQNRETLIVTVALSSASCLGLIVVSGWFSCELVVYNVYGGRKWLADIIWKNNILSFVQDQWSSIWEARKKIPTVKMDLERANFQILRRDTNVIDTGSHVDLLAFAQLRHEEAAMTSTQKARARWQAAMKKVLAEERRRSRRPVPKTQMSSKLGFLMDNAPIYISRYNTMPKLHRMTVSVSHSAEDIKQAAMVRCLQFSPNGLLLVSTRWNGRSTIFHLSDKAHPACSCTFPHPDKTGYVHQVDWAPNGEKLLMRSNRKLIVWSVDGGMGEPNRTEEDQVSEELRVSMMMERKAEANGHTMRSASWKPDSTGFIFAEGRRFLTINTLNQTSKLLPDNSSQHLELRSLCLSSDGLIVGTGRIVQEDTRLPKQYCIIIWELSKKFKVAKKIPVFYEISNVTLASDNRSLLVSYANKAPSQLWHITYDKKAAGLDLILRHNYRIEEQTGQEVSFAPLPSIFGGENDHLVLRATMTGDIHIWDRESAKHVYCVKPPPNLQGRVTSFTWNRGSEEYMFATGMHDGTVHIWTCGERRMMSEERQQLTASPTFDSDSDSQRHDSSGGRTTLCD